MEKTSLMVAHTTATAVLWVWIIELKTTAQEKNNDFRRFRSMHKKPICSQNEHRNSNVRAHHTHTHKCHPKSIRRLNREKKRLSVYGLYGTKEKLPQRKIRKKNTWTRRTWTECWCWFQINTKCVFNDNGNGHWMPCAKLVMFPQTTDRRLPIQYSFTLFARLNDHRLTI